MKPPTRVSCIAHATESIRDALERVSCAAADNEGYARQPTWRGSSINKPWLAADNEGSSCRPSVEKPTAQDRAGTAGTAQHRAGTAGTAQDRAGTAVTAS